LPTTITYPGSLNVTRGYDPSRRIIRTVRDLQLSSFRREISAGIGAARRGVELAESRVGANHVSVKEGRDVVTASDFAVEELVRSLLLDSLGQPVVGEEQRGARPSDRSGYWLVDPICGTRNYASGMSLYCVNLAFVQGDEVIAAVVADPSTSEISLLNVTGEPGSSRAISSTRSEPAPSLG
jgi:myo-inositol-1(or 4)-monophosphatase